MSHITSNGTHDGSPDDFAADLQRARLGIRALQRNLERMCESDEHHHLDPQTMTALERMMPTLDYALSDPDHAPQALGILNKLSEQHPIHETVYAARRTIATHIDDLVDRMKADGGSTIAAEVHRAIANLLEDVGQQWTGKRALADLWPMMRHSMENGAGRALRIVQASGIGRLFKHGTDRMRSDVIEWLMENVTRIRAAEGGRMVEAALSDFERCAQQLADVLLRHRDMDAAGLLWTWRQNGPVNNIEWYVRQNVERIMALDRGGANGIPSTLRKEFGIENFARYPAALLKRQYTYRDDDQHSYGLLVMPKTDHNSAFCHRAGDSYALASSVATELDRVKDACGMEVNLRICEVESPDDLAERCEELQRRYGDEKIAFAVLSGHGTGQGLQLGDYGSLDARNLKSRWYKDIRNAFADRVHVVLDSCGAGRRGGLAQNLSAVFDCTAHGTPADADVASIHIAIRRLRRGSRGRGLALDVVYADDKETRTYTRGHRVFPKRKISYGNSVSLKEPHQVVDLEPTAGT